MREIKTVPSVEESFERFVHETCGSPDGGTASSYRRAMELLTKVFAKNRPDFSRVDDVWTLTDPEEIMRMYESVKHEQDKFKVSRSGIFGPYAGRGDSYYRKGWCSAALRYFAQFRASESFEPKFASVLASSEDGKEIARQAGKIRLKNLAGYIPDDVDITTKEGKEIYKEAKCRIGQEQFRKWILGIYRGKCCVTGLDIPELLRASHIVAWASDAQNRMNPSNGLCLSATYDAAFDRHLISFDENYKMILSPSLKEHCTAEVHRKYFLNFEGQKIAMPEKCLPGQEFLEKHRKLLVA